MEFRLLYLIPLIRITKDAYINAIWLGFDAYQTRLRFFFLLKVYFLA